MKCWNRTKTGQVRCQKQIILILFVLFFISFHIIWYLSENKRLKGFKGCVETSEAVCLWINEMKIWGFLLRSAGCCSNFRSFPSRFDSVLIGRWLRSFTAAGYMRNIESSSSLCPYPTNLEPRLRRSVKAWSWGGAPAGSDLWLPASHFWSRQEERSTNYRRRWKLALLFNHLVSLWGNFWPGGGPSGSSVGQLQREKRWESSFL